MNDIATRTPVDRTAALVTSRGYEYTPEIKTNGFHSAIRPPVRPIPRTTKKAEGFIDCTGKKFGRLTVLGLSEKKSRWVVRCVCGAYEYRRTKAILNKENYGDACTYCRHLAYLKTRHAFVTTGREIDRRDCI